MKVMLESYQGEREIQPESLWPGLVLGGAALRAWQTARSRNELGRHTIGPGGVWLPSAQDSETDLRALKERAALQSRQYLEGVLSQLTLSDNGCWLPYAEDGSDHLGGIASFDASATPLENIDLSVRSSVQMCGSVGCQYPRHFDLTYSVPSNRRALLYPNTSLFTADEGGVIQTAWDDSLPPVEYSRQQLREFQRACSPYVGPRETLLTTGGIAQISLIPQTGCWFVRSYFMTPVGVNGHDNWQYDGYGRLRIPSHLSSQHAGFPGYAILAHRVTWLLSGRPLERNKVLNHMCGFRPCANPDHLEQVSTLRNNEHGIAMKRALADLGETVDK